MVVTDEKLVEEIIERPIKPEARSRAGPERPGQRQRQGGRAGGPSEPRRRRQSEARPGLLDQQRPGGKDQRLQQRQSVSARSWGPAQASAVKLQHQ